VSWASAEDLELARAGALLSDDPHLVVHLAPLLEDLPPSQWETLPMFLMPGGARRAAPRAPSCPGGEPSDG
jgi:hypothetical protein